MAPASAASPLHSRSAQPEKGIHRRAETEGAGGERRLSRQPPQPIAPPRPVAGANPGNCFPGRGWARSVAPPGSGFPRGKNPTREGLPALRLGGDELWQLRQPPPTAATKQSQRQWRGQLGWAGAREAEGAPGVFSVSFLAARPGTPAPVFPVVAASAPPSWVLAARRAKQENPIPAPSATCRSGRAPRSRPSSEAGAAAAGAGARAPRRRRPRWGAGWGRGGRGRLAGRDPRAQHPALPSHLPRRPLASLAAPCPARLEIQAHLFPPGFRAPRLAGTLGSDAERCDFSCVVLCLHRQDR